jgi:hypothetical protein
MKTIEEKNTVFDKSGRRIYPGDLLRTWHYGSGRRIRYLYHVAVMLGGVLTAVPTCHLEPTRAIPRDGVYPLWLCQTDDAEKPEIIAGDGPGDILDYRGRPKRQVTS